MKRDFFHCGTCDMVFVPSRFHLTIAAQLERYLTHNNNPSDPDYRKFLSRLSNALLPHLKIRSQGLDFGAGPGPALAIMLREKHMDVDIWDPLFFPDKSVLNQDYDFITCTETAEHFSDPAKEFILINSILRPSGTLGIMTGMIESWEDFPDLSARYYHRDPTHICFYSKQTMTWISEHFFWKIEFPVSNVTLFHKSA